MRNWAVNGKLSVVAVILIRNYELKPQTVRFEAETVCNRNWDLGVRNP